MMTIEDLQHKLTKLQEDHRDLDTKIDHLMATALYDQLAVQRLKKRKLQLKDEIREVRAKLVPDIIA